MPNTADPESPSALIDARIEELADWRGEVLARMRRRRPERVIPTQAHQGQARQAPAGHVRNAVKWNSPFYGIDGAGWFVSFHAFTNSVKVTFFEGTSLRPVTADIQAEATA